MRLLADMEVFVVTAKAQNFGRAALTLGMTASTLSRRITRLESELGFTLIRRSTRSFSLTESGAKFFARSQHLVNEAARAKEELSGSFGRVSGHLRVGSPSDLVTTVLAPVFAKYCRENASITLDILSTQYQPDLVRDSLDVAFSVAHQEQLSNSSHYVRQVGSFARMLYASSSYLKLHGAPASPPELAGHACIRHTDGAPVHQWDLHRQRKRQTVAVRGACISNSVIVSAQAAREHLGIVMLPQHLATHPSFGAGLVRVLPEWEGTPVIVFAVTADRTVPAKVEEIIRVARAEFSERVTQLESVLPSDPMEQNAASPPLKSARRPSRALLP